MSRNWQLQKAKNQLSRVVSEAREHGPQTITVHGRAAVVVLSVEEYQKLSAPRGSLVEFLQHSPLRGAPIKLSRSRDTGRRRVGF